MDQSPQTTSFSHSLFNFSPQLSPVIDKNFDNDGSDGSQEIACTQIPLTPESGHSSQYSYGPDENNSQARNQIHKREFDKSSTYSNCSFQLLSDENECNNDAVVYFSQHSASQARQSQFDTFVQSQTDVYQFTTYKSDQKFYIPEYRNSVLSKLESEDSTHRPKEVIFNEKERRSIIFWMIELCPVLQLSSRCVFVAVSYLDRLYDDSFKENIHLYAAACLFLASKIQSGTYPRAASYAELPDINFTKDDLLSKEIQLLCKLNYQCNPTVVRDYLQIWINDIIGNFDLHLATQFCSLCCLLNTFFSTNPAELNAAAIFVVSLQALGLMWNVDPVIKIIHKYGAMKMAEHTQKVFESVRDVTEDGDNILVSIFQLSEQRFVAQLDYLPIPIEKFSEV